MTQSPQEKLAALAQRAIPFLRDEGAKYEDDGSNEPLELARDIEQALSEHGEVVVTTDESGRCVAVTRQDSEGRILSVIWEAVECLICGGDGVDPEPGVEVTCCGRRNLHGDCCGNPEPEPVPQPCRQCRGGGKVLPVAQQFTTPPTPSAPVGVEAVLRRIVAEADTHPFNPIGHVIEHVVPEARTVIAQEKA